MTTEMGVVGNGGKAQISHHLTGTPYSSAGVLLLVERVGA